RVFVALAHVAAEVRREGTGLPRERRTIAAPRERIGLVADQRIVGAVIRHRAHCECTCSERNDDRQQALHAEAPSEELETPITANHRHRAWEPHASYGSRIAFASTVSLAVGHVARYLRPIRAARWF